MVSSQGYILLKGSEHQHPAGHESLNTSAGHETVTVTMIVRRKQGGPKMRTLEGRRQSRDHRAGVVR